MTAVQGVRTCGSTRHDERRATAAGVELTATAVTSAVATATGRATAVEATAALGRWTEADGAYLLRRRGCEPGRTGTGRARTRRRLLRADTRAKGPRRRALTGTEERSGNLDGKKNKNKKNRITRKTDVGVAKKYDGLYAGRSARGGGAIRRRDRRSDRCEPPDGLHWRRCARNKLLRFGHEFSGRSAVRRRQWLFAGWPRRRRRGVGDGVAAAPSANRRRLYSACRRGKAMGKIDPPPPATLLPPSSTVRHRPRANRGGKALRGG